MKLAGFTVKPACTPVPFNVTVVAGLAGSELEIERLPLAAPLAVGLKDNVTGEDCPAAIVFGVVIPLNPNPVPLALTEEIVRSAPPVFEIVRFEVPAVPTPTLPKLTEVLLKEIFGTVVPVPLRATVIGEFGALLVMVTVAGRFPAVVGANTALNVTLFPAAMLAGSVSPLTV